MTHPRARRFDAVRSDIRERGFDLDDDGPDLVAAGGDLPDATVDAPLAVTYPRDAAPLTAVSQVATAADEGRRPLLVVDEWTADGIRSLLSSPFLLADRRDGGRLFRSIEDRILLTDDTYACVPDGDLRWLEAPAAPDERSAGGPTAPTDDPAILLRVDDGTVAALSSVADLRCPGPAPSTFPSRYERGDDGRFLVYEGDEVVGSYRSVGAMRTDGYRPAPLPLVPEHHVRSNGRLARSALLARVEDGAVEYVSP